MSEIESASKEIVKRLAMHMREKMPELAQVLEEWPEPNLALKYPTLSIFSGVPAQHRHFQVVKLSQSDVEMPAKIRSKYIVGDYEWRLQLDLWCANKPERHRLYEKFYGAFNSQFVDDSRETLGLSLPLPGYHNIIARYDLVSYVHEDGEEQSQRKEWRSKIVVLANCHAILDKDEYKVVETEVEADIRHDILISTEEGA